MKLIPLHKLGLLFPIISQRLTAQMKLQIKTLIKTNLKHLKSVVPNLKNMSPQSRNYVTDSIVYMKRSGSLHLFLFVLLKVVVRL